MKFGIAFTNIIVKNSNNRFWKDYFNVGEQLLMCKK